ASRSPNGRGHVGSHGPCGRGKLAHPSPEGQATIYPRFEHRELPLEEIREQLPRRRDLDARGAAPPEHGETQGARADEEDFVVDAEHDGEKIGRASWRERVQKSVRTGSVIEASSILG